MQLARQGYVSEVTDDLEMGLFHVTMTAPRQDDRRIHKAFAERRNGKKRARKTLSLVDGIIRGAALRQGGFAWHHSFAMRERHDASRWRKRERSGYYLTKKQ